MTVQPIVLAAGRGTRMGNPDLPKVLTSLGEESLIECLLRSVGETGFLPAAIVVGFQAEMVKEKLGDAYAYVTQDKLLGTGYAVAACEGQLKGVADAFLVMYGDQPLWSVGTMQRLAEQHVQEGAVLSLATVRSDNPSFYNFGRIIREGGEVVAIREAKDCTPEELLITEYNPGLYCFSNGWLWDALRQLEPNNAQGEYYLTDLLEIALKEGKKVSSVSVTRWQESLGINTPEQLEEVKKWL